MSGRTYGGESATARLARRRRQLLDAGLELFGTAGYRVTTVRQLCREARVSDRYFYEQFDSTEDLLLAVYEESTARLEQAALAAIGDRGDPVLALAHRGLDAFLGALESDPRLARLVWFEVLGISPRVEATYLSRMQAFGHLMVGVLAEQEGADDVPDVARELMASTAVGAVSHTVMTWVSADFSPAREIVADTLARFLAGASAALLESPPGT
ncbi:TetR/AcrR family transcriptional regulator [Nocardioides sp.]|uniref:TetR/AcrR family transcriptional regulator n=1 Tax=Nocardioides sp. TaxID=35761 RepID=UPI00260C34B6|nr:TetR/AcrR family transcriptional regulator [Nocardioides sp.]MCW2739273.1 fadR 3 [Nocardioides sp.]